MWENGMNGKQKHRQGIGGILWRVFLVLAIAIGTTLVVKPVTSIMRRTSALRQLSIAAEHLGADELRKPILCARAPVKNEDDRMRVRSTLNVLDDSVSQAKAFCLLGESDQALTAFEESAHDGDGWSALQAYFLRAQAGEIEAAAQLLKTNDLSLEELSSFYTSVSQMSPDMDLLPVVRAMIAKAPTDKTGWNAWRQSGVRLSRLNNPEDTLQVYRQALEEQERLGVRVGRSSFAMYIGRIYQVNIEPRQLEMALAFYNQAIIWDEYLNPADEAVVHLYRGEVYSGLKPKYTATQVISEYRRALEIDPKNYWVRLDMANTYLYQLKVADIAEKLIRDAIDLYPELPNGYLSLGDLYRQQGSLSEAKTAYEQALTIKPDWQAALDRLTALNKDMEESGQ